MSRSTSWLESATAHSASRSWRRVGSLPRVLQGRHPRGRGPEKNQRKDGGRGAGEARSECIAVEGEQALEAGGGGRPILAQGRWLEASAVARQQALSTSAKEGQARPNRILQGHDLRGWVYLSFKDDHGGDAAEEGQLARGGALDEVSPWEVVDVPQVSGSPPPLPASPRAGPHAAHTKRHTAVLAEQEGPAHPGTPCREEPVTFTPQQKGSFCTRKGQGDPGREGIPDEGRVRGA